MGTYDDAATNANGEPEAMTSPTVTAVSDAELRDDVAELKVRVERCIESFGSAPAALLKNLSMREELLRARSALADVGETCKSCGGLGGHSVVGNHGDRYMASCEACNGTGKQPRPAAEVKCDHMGCAVTTHFGATTGDCTRCGQSFVLPTYPLSPAAHAAQVSEALVAAADAWHREMDAILRRLAEQWSAKP